MRRSIPPLLLTALLLAGCGGGGKSPTTTAAKPNGEATKSPTQVLADAQAAATSASSVRVAGHLVSGGTPVTLDLTIVRNKGAKGTMTANGLGFDLVRIGAKVYIKGSDAFYKKFAGAAAAQLLHDKWLEASATNGQLASLLPLTNTSALFAAIASNHGKLSNKGATTYAGQQVVEIVDTTNGGKLYVAATGKPYPVALSKKQESGTITFDGWNEPVSLAAPKGAIDISQLGG